MDTSDLIKARYDAYYRAVMGSERSRHTYRRRLKSIEMLANGTKAKSILDVGCGYGFRTIGIANSGATFVTGIDLDPERIEDARNYVNGINVENVAFKVMDAESMGFPDDTFDVVIADEMIHHIENLPAVFSEMYRVTKQNGVTVISDHNRWSLPSQVLRSIYFGKDKESIFSAGQVYGFLETAGYRNISYKHILFTLPFHNLPRPILSLNCMIESLIEKIPLARLQCGVYVIRGFK